VTNKAVLALETKDLCLLAAALGYLHGTVDHGSEREAVELAKNLDVSMFFENKNEFLSAIKNLNKRCAAQLEEQA